MKINKVMILTMVMAMSAFLFIGDGFARGRSGGGFRPSPRSTPRTTTTRSSGNYGSKKATVAKTPAQVKAQKAADAKKAQQAKIANDKKAAVAKQKAVTKSDAKSFKKMDTKSAKYTKTDAALTKAVGKSGKSFKTRGEAQKSLTSKLAKKKYDYKDSKTAMSNRPEWIPQRHMVGGAYVNTVYVGGFYGYMGPGGFMAYTASNMVVNDMMLRSQGYNPYVRPYYHPLTGSGVLIWFLVIIAFCVAVAVIRG